MIEATGGPHEGKVELYHELLGVGDDDLRRAVVWQLVADRSEAATDLLAMVAGRRSDDLARIADCELRRRRPGGGTEPAGSDTRADAAVDPPARRAFERLWEGYSEDSPPAGLELPHAIRVDGSEFLILVRAKLASARPVDRTRALCIARDLDLLVELQEQVYRLAHDPDPVVRSLAVGLLADLPGPTSQRILRIAVQDADPRVQANAIEALDKLDLEERIPATTAHLDSPHARVRANAVKSLLRVELEKAGEVLLDMLEDSSRAHRLSALWVVGRLQLRAVLRRVNDLSRNDSDERVRRRAGRIVHDLGRIGGVGRERSTLSANPLEGRRVGGAS
jgi:hypothetical protein